MDHRGSDHGGLYRMQLLSDALCAMSVWRGALRVLCVLCVKWSGPLLVPCGPAWLYANNLLYMLKHQAHDALGG
jgi:hypothetical protein